MTGSLHSLRHRPELSGLHSQCVVQGVMTLGQYWPLVWEQKGTESAKVELNSEPASVCLEIRWIQQVQKQETYTWPKSRVINKELSIIFLWDTKWFLKPLWKHFTKLYSELPGYQQRLKWLCHGTTMCQHLIRLISLGRRLNCSSLTPLSMCSLHTQYPCTQAQQVLPPHQEWALQNLEMSHPYKWSYSNLFNLKIYC